MKVSYKYENPYRLEDELRAAERRLSDARASGADAEDLIDLQIEIEELKERVNFAWQDDEF